MKKLISVCFAKTPGLTPAKTRLSATIGKEKCEKLYGLMLDRCFELMAQVEHVNHFFAINELEGRNHSSWKDHSIYIQKGHNLGEKLQNAENYFSTEGESFCFWGTDSASLTLNHFITLQDKLTDYPVVIIPARDGGFVLYGSNVTLPSGAWTSVKYSCQDTLRDLTTFLPTNHYTLSPLTDLDTFDDIEKVLLEMNKYPSQGKAWDKLKDFLENL